MWPVPKTPLRAEATRWGRGSGSQWPKHSQQRVRPWDHFFFLFALGHTLKSGGYSWCERGGPHSARDQTGALVCPACASTLEPRPQARAQHSPRNTLRVDCSSSGSAHYWAEALQNLHKHTKCTILANFCYTAQSLWVHSSGFNHHSHLSPLPT